MLGSVSDFVEPTNGFGGYHFLLLMLTVVIVNIVLIVYCMRKKKRESEDRIHSQVQLQVEKYFKLQTDSAF